MAAAAIALAPEILKAGTALIDRLFPDKTKQAEERAAALQHLNDIAANAQTLDIQSLAGSDIEHAKILEAEAGSQSLFVSGWYAFIGWQCGLAMGYQFLFGPLTTSLIRLWQPNYTFVPLQWEQLSVILLAMVGAGVGHYVNVNPYPRISA